MLSPPGASPKATVGLTADVAASRQARGGGMITLCIPTKDRPLFLGRLLHYYARTHYRHWIFIGDSSGHEQAEQNQRTVASLKDRLRIVYHLDPALSSCAALEQLSQRIATPYSALVCDDDFVCPTGLDRCMAFLTEHPEYGAAHGKALMLMTEQGAPYGTIGTVKAYPQPMLTANTGSERLREFFTLTPPALLYSVHRTDTWRAMFRGLSDLPGVQNCNIFKDELIPTCVSIIRGEVMELDGLYLVRQMHSTAYRHPHVYDWITDPDWFPSYQVFQERLVEELMEQDGMSGEQALSVVRKGFWSYVARYVMSDWQKDTAGRVPRRPSRLRPYAKRIPGARRSWRWMRARLLRWRDAFSLPALLDPRSPYHEDFMPLYEVITSRSVPVLTPQGQVTTRREEAMAAAE